VTTFKTTFFDVFLNGHFEADENMPTKKHARRNFLTQKKAPNLRLGAKSYH
jgi:hypothetical protein